MLCEEYAGRVAAMEQRCAEVELLRGENLRQGDALADAHQRLRAAEVHSNISVITSFSPFSSFLAALGGFLPYQNSSPIAVAS